jgi:hypothetical protein
MLSTEPLSRRMWLAGSAIALSPLSALGGAAPDRRLFVITRSKNANVVRYDARVGQDGRLDLREPVDAYWIMAAEDGRRERLTWLEREFAYGFKVTTPVRAAGFKMRLTAFDARALSVERDAGARYRVCFSIAGRRAVLRRIHVQTDERGVTPTVKHVDLFGVSAVDGSSVHERFIP